MGKTAVLAVKIIGDATGAKTAFNDAETGAGGFMGKLGKIGPAAAMVGGAIVTGVAAGTKALYGIGSTWDEVSDGIRTETGLSGAALEEAFQSAKNVASEIPASIEDIGATTSGVIQRMGLSGKTLETVSSQYLEAGRILGETVDIDKTSQAFAAFKIEGDGVVQGMDDLFRASQSSGVGMNDLAGIVTKAGPGLTNLGFSFAESATLAGNLDKAGLDAAATMNAMQKGMVTLARAGEEPQEAFQRVVGEIEGFVKAGDTASAIDVASKVFGTKGAAQFVAAVQSGTIGVETLMGTAAATGDTILGLGQETADAAEKWQILKNKAMVALEPIAGAIFDGAGKALDWLLNLVETFDWSQFTSGAAGVTGVLDGIWPLIQTIGDLFMALLPMIKATFEGIMGILGPALDLIANIIRTVTAVITGDWSGAWEGIKGIVSSAVDLIKGIVNHWIGQLKVIVEELKLGDLFTRAWEAGKRAVSSGIQSVVGLFRGLPGQITGALSNIGSSLANIGRNMIAGLIGGVKSMASRLVSSVRGVINDAIGAAKRLLGIHSPSKVFATIGTQTGQGLINGLIGQAGAVANASTRMIDAAIPTNTPEIPINLAYNTARTGSQATAGGNTYNITVNGALDPNAVARQIRDLLNRHARQRGAVNLAGTVIA